MREGIVSVVVLLLCICGLVTAICCAPDKDKTATIKLAQAMVDPAFSKWCENNALVVTDCVVKDDGYVRITFKHREK